MAVNAEATGKTYPPFEYEVGKEKIREYAHAVGEDNPVYFDRAAASEAGFRDVVAPPMFAVIYSWGAVALPAVDPEVDLNFAMLVHGGQEFLWGEPVCSGDVISTVATVKDIHEKGGMGFYVFETVSTNQDGAEVARACVNGAGGDPRSLKRLSVQFRGMGFPEQEITVTGSLKEERDGRVIVETQAEQGGKRIIRNAEAELEQSPQ